MTDAAAKKAVHLTSEDFDKTLKNEQNQPVFVDFFADWCGPCQIAGPKVDELAGEYQGKAIVAKLNVDEEPEIARKYGVQSIPTALVFKGDKEIVRQVGFPGKAAYAAMIDRGLQA